MSEAYTFVDKDGKGFITAEDLFSIFGHELLGMSMAEVVAEVNSPDESQVITYRQFCRHLKQCCTV